MPSSSVDLRRGEHGGRLVQDEAVGIAVEGLEDLGALLDPDRQVLDDGVGVHRQVVAPGQFENPVAAGRKSSRPQWTVGLLVAQHQVLIDREHRHQHEVLVHHADTRGQGVGRVRRRSPTAPSTRMSPSSAWYRP